MVYTTPLLLQRAFLGRYLRGQALSLDLHLVLVGLQRRVALFLQESSGFLTLFFGLLPAKSLYAVEVRAGLGGGPVEAREL